MIVFQVVAQWRYEEESEGLRRRRETEEESEGVRRRRETEEEVREGRVGEVVRASGGGEGERRRCENDWSGVMRRGGDVEAMVTVRR